MHRKRAPKNSANPREVTWCPGDPWVTAGVSLASPLSLPGSATGWFSDASSDSWKKIWILGRFRHVLGGPRGPRGNPKIHKKSILCAKKTFQTRFFDDFRRGNRLHVLRVIWHRLFIKQDVKKWWKNTCMFLQHRLFFWTRRPSQNIVFYDTKATFSVFFFLYFF